jgi:hypothetical protein
MLFSAFFIDINEIRHWVFTDEGEQFAVWKRLFRAWLEVLQCHVVRCGGELCQHRRNGECHHVVDIPTDTSRGARDVQGSKVVDVTDGMACNSADFLSWSEQGIQKSREIDEGWS